MSVAVDYIGREFGHARVIACLGVNANGSRMWAVRCGCGAQVERSTTQLGRAVKRGGTLQCPTCATRARSCRMSGRLQRAARSARERGLAKVHRAQRDGGAS